MKYRTVFRGATIVAAFWGLIITGGCKKALETTPYSYFTSDNFYTSIDEAYMATLGVYGAVSTWSGYGWNIPIVFDNDNDIGQTSGIAADNWRIIPHYSGIPETDMFYVT